ncbi:MAG: GntR family transcriptional regulator [Porticoccaceae bacterium]|nr:GntR family transcriptional regulator [Porticoccaceae bacterium]MDG1306787.1 GntR family transcriptional regulator [Porticoccaceae bacterium]
MSLSAGFRPLYKQVYELLTARLVEGYWKPSQLLPSEMLLAKELGVSQGTVRKALNQMVSEKMLQRQQGKGTFVAEHTQESDLFRFFRLREPHGEILIPETVVLSSTRRQASSYEAKKLDLDNNAIVAELMRVRSIHNVPAIIEKVIQPLSIFPDIDKNNDLPNALYMLYQEKYGITIMSVDDQVRAVQIPKAYAQYLKLPESSPVLMIERSSINIDGRVVELSTAYCSSENFVYSVRLT